MGGGNNLQGAPIYKGGQQFTKGGQQLTLGVGGGQQFASASVAQQLQTEPLQTFPSYRNLPLA